VALDKAENPFNKIDGSNLTQETNGFGSIIQNATGVAEEVNKAILPLTHVNSTLGNNSNHHNNITVNHVHIHTAMTPTSG
jgi:hypothetical protein